MNKTGFVSLLLLLCSLTLKAQQGKETQQNGTELSRSAVTDFSTLDVQPSFKGGDLRDFGNWLSGRTKYPASALMRSLEGETVVGFVVDEKGEITQTEVLKELDPKISKSLIRSILRSPEWSPGMIDGKPVRVYFRYGIYFHAPD